MSQARPLMTVAGTSVTSSMTVTVTPGSVRRIFVRVSRLDHRQEAAVDDDGDVRLGQIVDVRDDEDPGYENEVGVFKLARGSVTQHTEAGCPRASRR